MRARSHTESPLVEATAFGLATFRLARLVGVDDFPPIKRLRDRVVAGGPDRAAPRWLAEAIECPWCSSVYVAAALLALSRYPWFRRLLWIPAASAVAGVISTADSTLGRAWPEQASAEPIGPGITMTHRAPWPSPVRASEADGGST